MIVWEYNNYQELYPTHNTHKRTEEPISVVFFCFIRKSVFELHFFRGKSVFRLHFFRGKYIYLHES